MCAESELGLKIMCAESELGLKIMCAESELCTENNVC